MAGQPVARPRTALRNAGTTARRGRATARRAGASLLAAGCLTLAVAAPAHAAPATDATPPPSPGPVDAGFVATGPGATGSAGAGTAPHASGDDGADGATGYRFWSFWTQEAGEGEWDYATQGPGTLRPADGSAVGFRFGVSTNSGDEGEPRTAPAFNEVCDAHDGEDGAEDDAGDGAQDGGDGTRRVALVLDYGTAEDAPDGAEPPAARTVCADVPDGGTVADVLATEADPLRYDNAGLLCAIDGYPERGCGEETGGGGADGAADAEDGDPADERSDTALGDGSGSTSFGVWLGLAAVAVLAAAALGRSRRRGGA